MDLDRVDLSEIKEAIGALAPERRRELLAWIEEQKRPRWTAWRNRLRARFDGWPGLARAVAGTLIGLIGFACVDGAIFHSGWYSKYLEPNSMAGQVEYHLFWLWRMWPAKVPDVLVLGDSRMAEGFSAPAASAAVGGKVHFINFGMPGATPRVWYYTLLDAEKDRTRFSAIVIPFDHYSDIDGGEDLANRAEDMSYLAGRLHWYDCWSFSRSFTKAEFRREVLGDCLIRGLALRADVLAFLPGISKRLERAKDWRNHGASYIESYSGRTEAMTGLTFDSPTRTIHFPAGMTKSQIDTAKATVTPYVVPQTGALTAYRRRWIGAILDLYKNSATRFIFIQIPNAPLPLPDSDVPARFVDSVKGHPRLTVLPADTFHYLQKPEFFFDGLHLNRTGQQLFSAQLAKAVEPIVGAR